MQRNERACGWLARRLLRFALERHDSVRERRAARRAAVASAAAGRAPLRRRRRAGHPDPRADRLLRGVPVHTYTWPHGLTLIVRPRRVRVLS